MRKKYIRIFLNDSPLPLIENKGDLPTKLSAYVLYVYDKKSRDYKEVNHVKPKVALSQGGVEEQQTLSAFPVMTRSGCASVRVFFPHYCANLMIWQTTWGETSCGRQSVVF